MNNAWRSGYLCSATEVPKTKPLPPELYSEMSNSEHQHHYHHRESVESDRFSRLSLLTDHASGDDRATILRNTNASKYETDDKIGMFSDEDSQDNEDAQEESKDNDFDQEESYSTGLAGISEREKELMEMNERINAKTKKWETETTRLLKGHEEKLRRPNPSISAMTSNTSLRSKQTSSKTNAAGPVEDGIQMDTAQQETVDNHNVRGRTRSRSRASSTGRVGTKTDHSSFEEDEIDNAAKHMAPDAAMRFYKARTKAMERDMKEIIEELRAKDQLLGETQSKNRQLTDENAKLKKTSNSGQVRMEKMKKELDSMKTQRKTLEKENKELQRQLLELRKKEKQLESGIQSKRAGKFSQHELKYNRAMEEIEKLKAQISDSKKDHREMTDNSRRKTDKLQAENTLLQRQRHDLMLAFKKQMKLIGIFKRQKMHLEAARMLSFTEEQFVKAIDLAEDM